MVVLSPTLFMVVVLEKYEKLLNCVCISGMQANLAKYFNVMPMHNHLGQKLNVVFKMIIKCVVTLVSRMKM